MVATALMRHIVLPKVHACTKKARKQVKLMRVSSSSSVASSYQQRRNPAASDTTSETSSGWSLGVLDRERSFDGFSVRSVRSVGSAGSECSD
jgi:hypothetical protein